MNSQNEAIIENLLFHLETEAKNFRYFQQSALEDSVYADHGAYSQDKARARENGNKAALREAWVKALREELGLRAPTGV